MLRILAKIVSILGLFFLVAFPINSTPVQAQVNPCIDENGNAVDNTACRSVETDETLGSFFGKCQVNNSAAPGTETDGNQLTECIEQVLQVILIVSIIYLIIKITASNLGIIGKFGGGDNPVEETRKALQKGLTGILLIAGVTLLLGLFNNGTLNAGFLDFGPGRLAVDVPEPTPVTPTPNPVSPDPNAPAPTPDPNPETPIATDPTLIPCGFAPGQTIEDRDTTCLSVATGLTGLALPYSGRYGVSSYFGYDKTYPVVRYNNGTQPNVKARTHMGIDLLTPKGVELNPVAPGEVVFAGIRDGSGYGNHVVIIHVKDGITFYSLYAHMDTFAEYVDLNGNVVTDADGNPRQILAGDAVSVETTIGTSGNSNDPNKEPYGYHLHFQLMDSSYSPRGGSTNCKRPNVAVSCYDPFVAVPGFPRSK